MPSPYNAWLENCQLEADRLFEKLENLPTGLEIEAHKLIAWRERSRQLSAEIRELRERLWAERQTKNDAKARADAIAQRLNKEAEREMMLAQARRWTAEIAHLRRYIDRITEQALAEMRRRQAQTMLHQSRTDALARRKADQDLAAWEAFKADLTHSETPTPPPMPQDDQAERAQEQARLQAEYAKLKAQARPTEEENRAAWLAFTQDLMNPNTQRPQGSD